MSKELGIGGVGSCTGRVGDGGCGQNIEDAILYACI